MAFRLFAKSPNAPALDLPATTSTAYTTGSLVVRDTTNGVVIEATATVADNTIFEGLVTKTETTSGTAALSTVRVTLLRSSDLVVADCTANTASNQLCKAHLLTDARTVNNTSTHSTDKDAVFIALKQVGAASDKKLLGYISHTGQVVS